MDAQVKYAGFWIRLIAHLIDSTLLSVASWILQIIALGALYFGRSVLFPGAETLPSFWESFNTVFAQVLNVAIYLALALPYYVYGLVRWGTTLGKKPFSIYVVPADASKTGDRLTLTQALIRFVGYGASYLVFFGGYLMAAFHPEKRGLHDLMAGTVSIRRDGKRDGSNAMPASGTTWE